LKRGEEFCLQDLVLFHQQQGISDRREGSLCDGVDGVALILEDVRYDTVWSMVDYR
jgi:hypothetical protein